LARIDPGLLGPVRHRSAQAQIHLTVIRARAGLVGTRTALVNAARGLTKSYGERLKKCGTGQMNREAAEGLNQELRDALEGEIESLNERIAEYDRRIEQIAKEVRSEVTLLISRQPGCRMFSDARRQPGHLPQNPQGAQARRPSGDQRFRAQRRPHWQSLRHDVYFSDDRGDQGRICLPPVPITAHGLRRRDSSPWISPYFSCIDLI